MIYKYIFILDELLLFVFRLDIGHLYLVLSNDGILGGFFSSIPGISLNFI
jgi:hypothetical protein